MLNSKSALKSKCSKFEVDILKKKNLVWAQYHIFSNRCTLLVTWFMIYSNKILQQYTQTTLWHPYQHTHTIIAALFSYWLYNTQRQNTGIKWVFVL